MCVAVNVSDVQLVDTTFSLTFSVISHSAIKVLVASAIYKLLSGSGENVEPLKVQWPDLNFCRQNGM